MTKSRTRPARKSAIKADETPVKADGAPVKADAGTIRKALDELGINRPYYTCRAVGARLEFVLLGGDVVTWPADAAIQPPEAATRRRKSS